MLFVLGIRTIPALSQNLRDNHHQDSNRTTMNVYLAIRAINSVIYMMNVIHKVLRDFIPHIAIPCLDDIPIKGFDRIKDWLLEVCDCETNIWCSTDTSGGAYVWAI